jgi:hypothetical protein
MKNNETGEFELVVGNRQLLSAFAIVVLLFGVGVAMGYILGQNSPRSAKLQPDASQPPLAEQRPQPSPPAAPPQPASAPAAAADNAASAAAPTGEAQAPASSPTTQPAAQSPATQPAREAANPAAAQAPAAGASTVTEPPPGSYWQVMALPAADAEGVLRTLKEQGFPALLSPGTKNLTRVLVGPFKDTQSMGKAKTQLESAGFHPVKKSSE